MSYTFQITSGVQKKVLSLDFPTQFSALLFLEDNFFSPEKILQSDLDSITIWNESNPFLYAGMKRKHEDFYIFRFSTQITEEMDSYCFGMMVNQFSVFGTSKGIKHKVYIKNFNLVSPL